jgi:hypothetical protein
MARAVRFKIKQPNWLKEIRDKQKPVAEAAVGALRETAANSVQEGRRDIAAAGPGFGATWQQGLRYRTKNARDEGGGPSLQASAIVYHRYGIAAVFEEGATIEGRPLLWLPTRRGAPSPSKSGKKLVSATVRGTPLLFDAADTDRKRKPLYVGVPRVRIPKKFHITQIVEANVEKIAAVFIRLFKGD